MIMYLVKNGTPVLTAQSSHTINNSGHDLPITYHGDTSLLLEDMENLSVTVLEAIMTRIADDHGLLLSGDYNTMLLNDEVELTDRNGPS